MPGKAGMQLLSQDSRAMMRELLKPQNSRSTGNGCLQTLRAGNEHEIGGQFSDWGVGTLLL